MNPESHTTRGSVEENETESETETEQDQNDNQRSLYEVWSTAPKHSLLKEMGYWQPGSEDSFSHLTARLLDSEVVQKLTDWIGLMFPERSQPSFAYAAASGKVEPMFEVAAGANEPELIRDFQMQLLAVDEEQVCLRIIVHDAGMAGKFVTMRTGGETIEGRFGAPFEGSVELDLNLSPYALQAGLREGDIAISERAK